MPGFSIPVESATEGEERPVIEPLIRMGLRGGKPLGWPLEKFGMALGLPRIGRPHLERIAKWAVEDPDLHVGDGGEVVTAYLADPDRVADHAAFFRRSLEVGGYVKPGAPFAAVAPLCGEMQTGWIQTAPDSVLTLIREMMHPEEPVSNPRRNLLSSLR